MDIVSVNSVMAGTYVRKRHGETHRVVCWLLCSDEGLGAGSVGEKHLSHNC